MLASINFELSTQLESGNVGALGELGLKRKMSSNFYRNPNNVGQEHVTFCPVEWTVDGQSLERKSIQRMAFVQLS